jgi:hypothetical protein
VVEYAKQHNQQHFWGLSFTRYDKHMCRKLRIAFSAVCGILCLLLIVLWVRSHRAEDRASGRLSSIGIRLYSSRGWLVLFKNSTAGAGPYDWDITLGSDYWLNPPDARLAYAVPLSFFGRSVISNTSALGCRDGVRRLCHRPVVTRPAIPLQPPHAANRHDASGIAFRGDRVCGKISTCSASCESCCRQRIACTLGVE